MSEERLVKKRRHACWSSGGSMVRCGVATTGGGARRKAVDKDDGREAEVRREGRLEAGV
jgi:hypothetical protein